MDAFINWLESGALAEVGLPLVFLMLALLSVLVLWLLWRSRAPKTEVPQEVVALNAQLEKVTGNLEETTGQLHEARRDQALAEQRAALVVERDRELELRNDDIQQLSNENTTLKVRMEEERKNAAEKLQLLEQARTRMATEFENVAQRILEEKGGKLAEQGRAGIDAVLSPLRQQLEGFRKKVEDVYDKESRDRTALQVEITKLQELNERIGQDALNLTNALKGDSKVRGNWGEMVLERVLEVSGLRRGHEYDVQQSFYNEEGARLQPDVIVHLPEDKDIVIDSKLSLNAYEQYCSAATEDARALAMKQHVNAVRTHLRELGNKNYSQLKGLRTLDFVMMFVPVEAAFISAMDGDKELFQEAYQRQIIMVSPSTLLAVLRTVANTWRTEHQNNNAVEIARKAGNLYDKFVNFIASLEEVGMRLDKAQEAYGKAHKRLSSGTGNLVRRAEELKKMGASARKALPRQMLDEAGAGSAAANDDDKEIVRPDAFEDGPVVAIEAPAGGSDNEQD